MSKISRNDPCPCGSGEKYKKCCIDKVLPFSGPNGINGEELKTPKQLLELVKAKFADTEVGSLDEMNQKLSRMMNSFNSVAKSPFLGLSPAQMHNILYTPFSFQNEVFSFECGDINKLKEVPLLKHSLYLLNRLKDEGEIKATQTGNLPRAFVREMYHEFFSNDRYARLPSTEDDILSIVRVRHVLDLAGLIKKKSNKFSLTKKGEGLLQENKLLELYNEIFLVFMNEWNWAHGDRYSELGLVQRSAVFNIFLIHKECQDWIHNEELGKSYLEAFPALVNEASGYFGPEEEIINCFSTRFLSRVCLPLGLLELKEEEGEKVYDRKEYFRVTRFFVESFKFRRL
jgi:hypothetical protein